MTSNEFPVLRQCKTLHAIYFATSSLPMIVLEIKDSSVLFLMVEFKPKEVLTSNTNRIHYRLCNLFSVNCRMRSLTLDIWVKATDRTPTARGSYKIKVGEKNPTFHFFDCSESHKNEWIKLNLEWREVK